MNSPAVSDLVQAEASKSRKSPGFSEIDTLLTFLRKLVLGASRNSINCLVFFGICATRTQPAAPNPRKSHIICEWPAHGPCELVSSSAKYARKTRDSVGYLFS